MWRVVGVLVLVVIPVAVVLSSGSPGAGQAAPAPPAAAGVEYDFGAKVVAIATKVGDRPGESTGGGYFEKVKLRRMGDRYFLVGQAAPRGKEANPYQGVLFWYPLAEVTSLMEFDSMEAALKAYEAYEKRRPAGVGGNP
jgi:hypothetical protein